MLWRYALKATVGYYKSKHNFFLFFKNYTAPWWIVIFKPGTFVYSSLFSDILMFVWHATFSVYLVPAEKQTMKVSCHHDKNTMTFFSFIFSFFLSVSFSHSFVAQACASRVPIFIPAKQASLARRANFTSIWVYEWKRFSSLILNYWQPNSLCFFVSFAKLIKSVFKILFSPTKSFFCFHLGYLNLGESIKHN